MTGENIKKPILSGILVQINKYKFTQCFNKTWGDYRPWPYKDLAISCEYYLKFVSVVLHIHFVPFLPIKHTETNWWIDNFMQLRGKTIYK